MTFSAGIPVQIPDIHDEEVDSDKKVVNKELTFVGEWQAFEPPNWVKPEKVDKKAFGRDREGRGGDGVASGSGRGAGEGGTSQCLFQKIALQYAHGERAYPVPAPTEPQRRAAVGPNPQSNPETRE